MNITNAAFGFSALLSGTTVPEDSPIKYTNVLADKGVRYDPSTTVPEDYPIKYTNVLAT